MNIGIGEWLLLGFIITVVFSASRMGQIGNALGQFVYSFKKAQQGEPTVDMKKLERVEAPEDAQVIGKDRGGTGGSSGSTPG